MNKSNNVERIKLPDLVCIRDVLLSFSHDKDPFYLMKTCSRRYGRSTMLYLASATYSSIIHLGLS